MPVRAWRFKSSHPHRVPRTRAAPRRRARSLAPPAAAGTPDEPVPSALWIVATPHGCAADPSFEGRHSTQGRRRGGRWTRSFSALRLVVLVGRVRRRGSRCRSRSCSAASATTVRAGEPRAPLSIARREAPRSPRGRSGHEPSGGDGGACAALQRLEQAHHPAVPRLIGRVLEDPDPMIAAAAIRTLGDIGDEVGDRRPPRHSPPRRRPALAHRSRARTTRARARSEAARAPRDRNPTCASGARPSCGRIRSSARRR